MARTVSRSNGSQIEPSRPKAAAAIDSAAADQLVETAPSGAQWLHEIKLDGFRMGPVLRAATGGF
jgi:ATP-dependent DNA ligase